MAEGQGHAQGPEGATSTAAIEREASRLLLSLMRFRSDELSRRDGGRAAEHVGLRRRWGCQASRTRCAASLRNTGNTMSGSGNQRETPVVYGADHAGHRRPAALRCVFGGANRDQWWASDAEREGPGTGGPGPFLGEDGPVLRRDGHQLVAVFARWLYATRMGRLALQCFNRTT